jgi:hypothetical protein
MAGGGRSPCIYLLIFPMADFCWLIFCGCGGACKKIDSNSLHYNCPQLKKYWEFENEKKNP